ncbi:MAG: hypothetical protein ACR2PH_06940, partial [Desulfobulbia bacterium]
VMKMSGVRLLSPAPAKSRASCYREAFIMVMALVLNTNKNNLATTLPANVIGQDIDNVGVFYQNFFSSAASLPFMSLSCFPHSVVLCFCLSRNRASGW